MKCGTTAASLRHRVTLERPVANTADSGQVKVSYTSYASRPANAQSIGGVERTSGNQVVATQRWTVVLRLDKEVNTNWRVLFDGHELNVTSITVDDRKVFMTLNCTEKVL